MMKSVVVFDYWATGEGETIQIIFSNSSNMSDQDAVDKMKESLDPYFHVGIKVLPLESIEFDIRWMKQIELHLPALYRFIMGEQNYLFSVDYRHHVNYS